MLVLGAGKTIAAAPLTTTAMDPIAASHAGFASGIDRTVTCIAALQAL